MAFLETPFDINDIPVEEKRDFEPIPAGWYTAAIAGAASGCAAWRRAPAHECDGGA